MTTFWRSGHWRTRKDGTRYWVKAHKVTRDGPYGDWHTPRYVRPRGYVPPRRVVTGPVAPIAPASRSIPNLVAPNAKCPVCGRDAYFYANRHGSRVYFDVIGPPWTKHPCIPPSHIAQSAWESSREGELIMPDARTATSREAWATARAVEVVASEHHIQGGLVVTVIQRVSGRQGTMRWLDQSIDIPPAGSLLFEHGGRVTFISRALVPAGAPITLLGGDLELGTANTPAATGDSLATSKPASVTGCLVGLALAMALALLVAIMLAP